MDVEEFQTMAQEVFESLPESFKNRLENVCIVIEETASTSVINRTKTAPTSMLLGLYEGVPISKRGSAYGSSPVIPDKITLFKKNIERVVSGGAAIREKIREVLIHEIGHHFGMSEKEIQKAGY